ncbi:MAG: cytochrome C [Desulfobulbaceae bacterium]|uniref:Cytochrome C n=1 Tax=Candidatus Desulfobia pelagia TaxID=2841692 RepID=A0A8J6NGX8_9BACT|nr:cytochrome C [Candidatus Desulfobia pelagia]
MKKAYKKGIVVSALTTAALLIGTQAFAAHTDAITLRDANGTPIATGSSTAYSAKMTCGECHDYDAIERHSFHAQLAANEHAGFNPWVTGNMPSIAAKGKPWVQATGHLGKW